MYLAIIRYGRTSHSDLQKQGNILPLWEGEKTVDGQRKGTTQRYGDISFATGFVLYMDSIVCVPEYLSATHQNNRYRDNPRNTHTRFFQEDSFSHWSLRLHYHIDTHARHMWRPWTSQQLYPNDLQARGVTSALT